MTEFTGERVIPGEVNDDLWAEHLARYAFSVRHAEGKHVLDIGCGTGYGAAELAQHAEIAVGVDLSVDAANYALSNYPLPNLHFLTASAEALPFVAGAFDLVTAFEVIEHLRDWRALLAEAKRVIHPGGLFLVSTPNKIYYAESRAGQGPNPFHIHEFELAEFRATLNEFFPNVTILLQNRVESFAFYPHATFLPVDACLDRTGGSPTEAHFFLALCSINYAPPQRSFVYVPRASNLLREREQHIFLLQDQLAKTKAWLDDAITDHQRLLDAHEEQRLHLEEHNRWALQLDKDWKAGLERIVELQDQIQADQAAAAEMAGQYQLKVVELEEENRRRAEWALETEQRLSAALELKCQELAETVHLLDTAEATVVERTLWAQGLEQRLQTREAQLRMIRDSRWCKLGRAIGLGPRVDS